MRGLVRRMLPRCVSGPAAQGFYEKDAGDAGSVRRYRMDVSEGEEEEKERDVGLKMRGRKLERETMGGMGKKKWGCF